MSNGILDSGERTTFSTGANRDMHTGKGRMDLLPATAIIELSKHCENGALKYGERNVDKGIPQHSFVDSGLRHLFKYLRGDTDENHLVAAAWNVMWALEQEVNKPELNDLPNRIIKFEMNSDNESVAVGVELSCKTCGNYIQEKSSQIPGAIYGHCPVRHCFSYSKWIPKKTND